MSKLPLLERYIRPVLRISGRPSLKNCAFPLRKMLYKVERNQNSGKNQFFMLLCLKDALVIFEKIIENF